MSMPATMTVLATVDKLDEGVVVAFLSVRSFAQLPDIFERLGTVENNLPESDFDEICKKERDLLGCRKTELLRARDGMKDMLGNEPCEEFPENSEVLLGCKEGCREVHGINSECLVCCQTWSVHFGQYCKDGRRGSWREEEVSGRFFEVSPEQSAGTKTMF